MGGVVEFLVTLALVKFYKKMAFLTGAKEPHNIGYQGLLHFRHTPSAQHNLHVCWTKHSVIETEF
jgi:hypothetical protein